MQGKGTYKNITITLNLKIFFQLKINTHTRCVLKNESYCYENFLENSLPKIKFIRNEQLSPNNGANEIVQLKPQRLKLTNIQPGILLTYFTVLVSPKMS